MFAKTGSVILILFHFVAFVIVVFILLIAVALDKNASYDKITKKLNGKL